jgi:hypothetical protein
VTLDTRTIVLVTRRLFEMCARPALFNDRMPPHRAAARLSRILGWLGSTGRIVASEHIRRHETPPAGKRKWARGGYRSIETNDGN